MRGVHAQETRLPPKPLALQRLRMAEAVQLWYWQQQPQEQPCWKNLAAELALLDQQAARRGPAQKQMTPAAQLHYLSLPQV